MSEVSYNISGICDPSFEQVKKVFINKFSREGSEACSSNVKEYKRLLRSREKNFGVK